jgi:YYY domain-containing protein
MKAARNIIHNLLLLFILVLASALRLYNLNWDQGHGSHPDENHVSFVITSLNLPNSTGEYFDSGASPLNPYNADKGWVYGMLPLLTGKAAANYFEQGCAPVNAPLQKTLGRWLSGNATLECSAGYWLSWDTHKLVSRLISALSDILTVFVVYLTGRRLFGRRVGLLASAFSALAVLQIQHAHFAVVESMTVAWVSLAMLFIARVVTTTLEAGQRPFGLWANVVFGALFTGFAVASKISVWPLAALLVLAIMIVLIRDRRPAGGAIADAVLAAIIAGAVTFAGFRVAQPYGFVGNSAVEWQYAIRDCGGALTPKQIQTCTRTTPMPDTVLRITKAMPEVLRPVLAPSPRWVSELQNAASASSGQQDPPFGWQWANRAPVSFPLVNIVFYGLGVPLGIAALCGVLLMLRNVLDGRRWYAYLIPAIWTTGFFLYQGTQFVKSIRYQLPIYPMLCIAAAVFLLWLWRRLPVQSKALRFAPAAFVLGGTALWCAAFMNAYTGELTRTEASRWIFQNAPTAITLAGENGGAQKRIPLPVTFINLVPQSSSFTPFRLSKNGDGLNGPLKNPVFTFHKTQGAGRIEASVLDAATQQTLQTVSVDISAAQQSIRFDAAALEPDREYNLVITQLTGDALSASGSTLANQHWDEGLPFRVDGKDPFGGYYNGVSLDVYNEEDPGKDLQMVDALDQADFLILSTNRHYPSVTRLPWRFPMTIRYYEELFAGNMGFKLVGDFRRSPRLGPFMVNDQEMPFYLKKTAGVAGNTDVIEVPYPTAEEAFSVYDHPRVLIFQKTADFSRERAAGLLGVFDLTRSVKRTAFASNNTPGGLRFDSRTLADQRAGGTWSELFPRNSPLNQSQTLATLAWLALIEALGLAAFFMLMAATRKSQTNGSSALIDGGYATAKALGLLLVGWIGWLLASTRITTFEPALLWVITAVVIATGLFVGHLNREHIFALLRTRGKVLLAAELVFLVSFGVWLAVRAGNPDLWHPYKGGEKPMDFAMLNSILKSSYFPPSDAWFAGGYINYYYFGFVFIGWPIKALGIDPAVAYNLAVPTLFALTAAGAFSVAATLYARWRPHVAEALTDGKARPRNRGIIAAGVLAALFCVYIGNSKQIETVRPLLQELGERDGGGGALPAINGLIKWLNGAELPGRIEWPYWNASRPSPEVIIGEFPHFTFLYADLHAHMMTMPIALLALTLALAFAGGARSRVMIGLAALAAGALFPANTWDFYPYALLIAGGMVIGRFAGEQVQEGMEGAEQSPWERWINAALTALPSIVVMVVLTRAFFGPFHENFGQGYGQIEPWLNERTPLGTYLAIHGLFLIPIVVALLRFNGLFGMGNADPSGKSNGSTLALGALGAGALIAVVFVVRSASQSTAAISTLISAPLTLLAIAAAFQTRGSPVTRMAWLMTGGAMALTLFVEHFTLRGDIGRMNTQFKFYIIVWLLLSTAGAAAFVSLFDPEPVQAREPDPAPEAAPAASLVFESNSDGMPELVNRRPAEPVRSNADVDEFLTYAGRDQSVDTPAPVNGVGTETRITEVDTQTYDTDTFSPDAEAPEMMPPTVTAGTEGIRPPPAAVAAPASLPALWPLFRSVVAAAVAVLIGLGALYPVFAIPAKVADRYVMDAPRGLDGMAYMQSAQLTGYDLSDGAIAYPLKSDYDAIRWLQDNVRGSPTIIEGHAGGAGYYWAGRFSIYTGLPGVIGWQWHQRQQRGEALLDSRVIYDRFTDVESLYITPDMDEAQRILRRYQAKYVIVSTYERNRFGESGMPKFDAMMRRGDLQLVYSNADVRIFEVTDGA